MQKLSRAVLLMSFASSLHETSTFEVHIGSFFYIITHIVTLLDN